MKLQPSDNCMSSRQKQNLYKLSISITVTVWVTVMFLFFPSCGKKEQQLASAVKESDSLPDMRTIGVTTLISDSGMIRYKIITAEWLIYSHRNPPFWAFEKGIYLEKFVSIFHVLLSFTHHICSYHIRNRIVNMYYIVHN